MWSCSHEKKHLITETDYRGTPEKIYSCLHCGMIIAEAVDGSEPETVKTGVKHIGGRTLN